MRAIAIILIILSLVVGVVPQFTDCLSQGKAITLPSGSTLPMKCHWTRQAEVAVALPLAAVGLLLAFVRGRGTQRALAVVTLALGAAVMLVPSVLIGVCGNPEMICNMLMRPVLLFAGFLTFATGAVGLVYLRGEDPALLYAEIEERKP
jgi:hypothetical protein